MNLKDAVKLRDKLAIAISANEDWAPTFKDDKQQFKKLLGAEAKLTRQVRAYFKDLADNRILGYVDWVKYKQALPTQAAKPNLKVIVSFSDEDISTEVGIVTKIVFEEITAAVTAGALSQITKNKIPVTDLSTLVDNVARDRAAYLATAMTDATIDRVRTSIETSLKLGEDVTEAADRLGSFIDDPTKAEMVAKTETASAWREGVLESGKAAGATMKSWHTVDNPCELCVENEEASPIPIDDQFPNGDDPHPNCKCDQSVSDFSSDD